MTKTATKPPPTAPPDLGPLFPIPLPVVGVCGEFKAGKTSFILSIDPGPRTRIYDFELSSASYVSLGFDRIDVYDEMLKTHPKGYKGSQVWDWFRASIQSIKPGRFTVIGVDTISPIESALGEWVMENAGKFNRTRKQYVNNLGQPTGLFWGDLKATWESALVDVASRCECFAFSAQMGTVYAGNAPTQKRKGKGKETLMQLASLYLRLERKPDARGNLPREPSAIVEKERVNRMTVVPGTRRLQITPLLPPRLPVATPEAIRAYMLAPPDYSALRPEELAPEERLSDDERLELRARTAEAEATAAQARVESARLEREREPQSATEEEPVTLKMPHPAGDAPAPIAYKPRPVADDLQAMGAIAGTVQVTRLVDLREELWRLKGMGEEEQTEAWSAILRKRNASCASELTPEQADDLIAALSAAIEAEQEDSPEQGAEGG